MKRKVLLLAASCWLLSAAQVAQTLAHPGYVRSDHFALGVLALAGLGSCAAWFAEWRYGRAAVMTAAALYLALYCQRTWALLIEPQMSFMGLSFFEAVCDSYRSMHFYITRSLSLGNVLVSASELFFEWLMPLAQVAVLAAATGATRREA